MPSYMYLIVFGLLLLTVTIVIQSAPVEPINENILLAKRARRDSVDPVNPPVTSSSSITTSTTAPESNDIKKKRYIEDYSQFDEFTNDNSDEDVDDISIEHKLHPKIKETPGQIHDRTDKPVDTDISQVFSDFKMTPNDLTNLARKRRNINLNDESNQRRKRALSTYDFYNTDPLYESLIDQQQFVRPTRAFAPIYWYPSLYERNIRSALASSFYEPSDWNRIAMDTIENDDSDEDQDSFLNDEDENAYEYNRYPISSDFYNIPYDNLQLQQEYNIDDLPIYDDDDGDQDEEFFSVLYEPNNNYFKIMNPYEYHRFFQEN